MNELKITPPKGYEIDRENSTLDKIIFKEKEKLELPKNWNEFCDDLIYNPEYYIDKCSDVQEYRAGYVRNPKQDRNLHATKDDAEAILAFTQLRRVWQGFRDDLNGLDYPAYFYYERDGHYWYITPNRIGLPIWFNDRKTAKEFLENYKELFDKVALLYE